MEKIEIGSIMFGRHGLRAKWRRGEIEEIEYRNELAKSQGYKSYAEKMRLRSYEKGHLSMCEAKNSSSYLGVYIAENVLRKVFENVEKMPYGNKGFDFICNKGYKIDVKSACADYIWLFYIGKNKIADYFLMIAFDNRENLNPVHLWLVKSDEVIRGRKLNKCSTITILTKDCETLSKYELIDKLDKIKEMCEAFRKGGEIYGKK